MHIPRRFPSGPRYMGDVREEHVECPEHAKVVLRLAQTTIRRQAKKLQTLRTKVAILNKQVSSLKSIVNVLQKRKKLINS